MRHSRLGSGCYAGQYNQCWADDRSPCGTTGGYLVKVTVVMDVTDTHKIVEVDLSRDDCESIYAMSHVLAKPLGQLADDVKSGMATILNSVPQGEGVLLTIPFTALAAANVLGMCSAAIYLKPSGPHLQWVAPVSKSVADALRSSAIRVQILIDGKAVFSPGNG